MRLLLSLFTFCFLTAISLSAQIDTSYYLPKYPTGQDGLVRDIVAFSKMTEAEKKSFVDKEIELNMIILIDGAIADAFVRGIDDSDLKARVEGSVSKLHDFIPAKWKGENVQANYTTTLSFDHFFPQPILVRDLSLYEEKAGGWSR